MLTKIGNYELGQSVDTSSLREVSKDEWAGLQKNNYPNYMKSKIEKNFSIEDYKKNMAFDKMYENEKVSFLGVDWLVQIFTKNDKIWTIIASRWAASKEECEFVFKKAFQHITENMGKHTKNPFLSKKFIWEWKEEDVGLVKGAIWGNGMVAISLIKKDI